MDYLKMCWLLFSILLCCLCQKSGGLTLRSADENVPKVASVFKNQHNIFEDQFRRFIFPQQATATPRPKFTIIKDDRISIETEEEFHEHITSDNDALDEKIKHFFNAIKDDDKTDSGDENTSEGTSEDTSEGTSEETSEEDDCPSENNEDEEPPHPAESKDFDPWTLVWYIGSFGGLIVFFLMVSCSEWCCRKYHENCPQDRSTTSGSPLPSSNATSIDNGGRNSPPPGYHLFAPPDYNHVNRKDEFDVYVVPTHACNVVVLEKMQENVSNHLDEDVPPPSYHQVTMHRSLDIGFREKLDD